MKIRNGFVSNSSSSSFIIIGKELGYNEIDALVEGKFPDSVEGVYVRTHHYLCDGEDFFKLTPEMAKNLNSVDFDSWDFINVSEIICESGKIKIKDCEGLSLFSVESDYNSTRSLDGFNMRYFNED